MNIATSIFITFLKSNTLSLYMKNTLRVVIIATIVKEKSIIPNHSTILDL